jgi:hypothetical protein
MLWGGAFLHNIQETVTFTNLPVTFTNLPVTFTNLHVTFTNLPVTFTNLHVIGFVEFYALLDANNNVVLEFIFSAL